MCAQYPGISKDTWKVQNQTSFRPLEEKDEIAFTAQLGSIDPSTLRYTWSRCWMPTAFSFWLPSLGTEWFSEQQGHCPLYSPDLSPLDFSFWSPAMTHLCRLRLSTLHELKIIVNDFAANIVETKMRKIAANTKRRTELSMNQQGSSFEHHIRVWMFEHIRFGLFTPIHQIVNNQFVRNIYFIITSNGSFCISSLNKLTSVSIIYIIFIADWMLKLY